jgi:hypothetical protein
VDFKYFLFNLYRRNPVCDKGVKNPPAEEVGVNFVVFHVMYYGDAIDTETSID